MLTTTLFKGYIFGHLRPTLLPRRRAFIATLVLAICSACLNLSAQTVTTLLTFSQNDGQASGLTQGTDGNFYGGIEYGGTLGGGTVFKITPQGALTTLYDFCDGDGCGGRTMVAGLTQGTDGNSYGTTFTGGNTPDCNGTVFKMTKQGTLTWLYDFCYPYPFGELPEASMVQAQDGNFYGTTNNGGSSYAGTLFRITPQGQLTTIHTFCSQTGCADGSYPSGPGLLLGADGLLYGTTGQGIGYGTVFKTTLPGKFTTLYTFCSQSNCTDGRIPGPIVQTPDGTLYGTTYGGGLNGLCNEPDGCGTIFRITPAGQFTTIHSFCQELNGFYCADGNNPLSLAIGSDGNLYGTTQYGGDPPNGGQAIGTIFRMTPAGTVTTLYTFCTHAGCPDGAWPSKLVQSTNGTFFGETESSPSTIFKLDAGLPPFVRMLRRFGKVGTNVVILGNNLSSATGVSFNGTPADFTVPSNSEVETTVPAGSHHRSTNGDHRSRHTRQRRGLYCRSLGWTLCRTAESRRWKMKDE